MTDDSQAQPPADLGTAIGRLAELVAAGALGELNDLEAVQARFARLKSSMLPGLPAEARPALRRLTIEGLRDVYVEAVRRARHEARLAAAARSPERRPPPARPRRIPIRARARHRARDGRRRRTTRARDDGGEPPPGESRRSDLIHVGVLLPGVLERIAQRGGSS